MFNFKPAILKELILNAITTVRTSSCLLDESYCIHDEQGIQVHVTITSDDDEFYEEVAPEYLDAVGLEVPTDPRITVYTASVRTPKGEYRDFCSSDDPDQVDEYLKTMEGVVDPTWDLIRTVKTYECTDSVPCTYREGEKSTPSSSTRAKPFLKPAEKENIDETSTK